MVLGPSAYWGYDAPAQYIPFGMIDAQGSFPPVVNALGGYSGIQPVAAASCAAGQSTLNFSFCAQFATYQTWDNVEYTWTRLFTGTLTVLSTPYTNAWGTYHIVVGGSGFYVSNGTEISVATPPQLPFDSSYSWSTTGTWNLNSFQQPTNNFLYSSTNGGKPLVDDSGVQLIVHDEWDNVFAVVISAFLANGSPTWRYVYSTEQDYDNTYYQSPSSAAQFQVTAGQSPPTCPIAVIPLNYIVPAFVQEQTTCTGLAQVVSTYGDNNVFDYVHDQEGNALQPNTVYTVPFSALQGSTVQQMSFDVLNNADISQVITVQLGVYSSSGALLSGVVSINLTQVIDQQLFVDLPSPIVIPATGGYYLALIASQALRMATSSYPSPSMSYTGKGLPSTFTASASAFTIPLAAHGCVTATHSMCASFQYFVGGGYSPLFTAYVYQALLFLDSSTRLTSASGTANPVVYAVGHMSVFVRPVYEGLSYLTSFSTFSLSPLQSGQTNFSVYSQSTSGATLDRRGLSFANGLGYNFSLFYDPSLAAYADSTNVQLGSQLLSRLTIQPMDLSKGVPSCSLVHLPQTVSPALCPHRAPHLRRRWVQRLSGGVGRRRGRRLLLLQRGPQQQLLLLPHLLAHTARQHVVHRHAAGRCPVTERQRPRAPHPRTVRRAGQLPRADGGGGGQQHDGPRPLLRPAQTRHLAAGSAVLHRLLDGHIPVHQRWG